MKKLYLIISLVLCQIMAYSQTILNQQEAVSRTVSDPQAVILAPGFHAKSDVVNPFVANVGGTIVNPNNPTGSQAGSNNPSGTTSPPNTSFHDTQGNIDVNGGGQLQYTLPIALPPGIKSVAPQINLVYTSGSGNGIAGYGWSLSGVTSISRMGRTIEKDGEVRGVQLDYTDYYSFNGQRLILKSGEYGKDGAEYVTEKFSNVRIRSLGTISGQQWQGPEYWEVTFEDGSQAWYGATAIGGSPAARTPVEYNIVKWKDAQGNYITYNYTQGNNVAIISNITWGGNETHQKPHFNEINFAYSGRGLKETSYLKGVYFSQESILNNVIVKTNNSIFKRYQITYQSPSKINGDSNNTIGYKYPSKITEYNSEGKPANSVDFTTNDNLITKTEEKPFVNFENIITSGDYNGDGLIDYIVKQPAQNGLPAGYYVYFDAVNNGTSSFVFLPTFGQFFTSHILTYNIKSSDNIVKPKQGLLLVKNNSNGSQPPVTGSIELDYYTIKSDVSVLNTLNNPLVLEMSKTINTGQYEYDDSLYPLQTSPDYEFLSEAKQSSLQNPKEIDIDSDGLSELVFAVKDTKCYQQVIVPDPIKTRWDCRVLGYRYIVIDNSNIVNNSFYVIPPIDKNILSKSSIMDFDNDGKQDIMYIKETGTNVNVTFYTRPIQVGEVESTAPPVVRTHSTPLNNVSQYEIIKIGSNYSISLKNVYQVKGITDDIQFGDLNGDKNIEILAPIHYNNTESGDYYNTGWSFYLNKGNALIEDIQGFSYRYKNGAPDFWGYNFSYPVLMDIDSDGKSEIVNMYNVFSVGTNIGHTGINLYREFKYDASNPQIKWSYTNKVIYKEQREKSILYPIYGDFRINSSNSKILVISKSIEQNSSDRRIISYHHYNLGYDKNITSITQGGLTTQVDYRELDPSVNQGLYASVKAEQYPFMELDKISQSYVVASLFQQVDLPTNQSYLRVQDFKYRGFLTHLQGKGMLGFRQTARSNWYVAGNSSTKIWSGAEIDPLNESVPIKEWSVKADDDDALIFPSNLPESNTPLLSFKSTEYKTDKLLNGNLVTSYTEAQKPNLVTAIVPVKTTTKDFKKDVLTESTIEYDMNGLLPRYYLPTRTTTDVNSGFGKSVTEMQYTHNSGGLGKDYFVGRPTKKIEKVTAYGDTKGSTEEYYYENNLLQSLIKYAKPIGMSTFAVPGVPAEGIKETYQYDAWGNVLEKFTEKTGGVDAIGDTPITITEKAQYDNKGRFVIKKTDNLGLETNIEYNDWGQITKQTDPLGLVLENTYDGWGKLLASSTNLSGRTSYTYKRETNGDVIVTEYSPDGGEKITYTNKLGQNYKTSAKGFNQGSYVSKSVQYDALGRQEKESEPYYEGETAKWNSITYDDTNFPYSKVTATSFIGKEVETSISERTTTIRELNGNLITRTKTTDALGNVISSTDKGGTINFTYNAVGQQLSASYGTNKVTTKYDDWGRKTEFNDPSNGTYKYAYNIFGNILRATSPKGYKQYTYNNKGQLINQKEVSDDGTSTNKNINFSYNNKGLITDKIGTSNGKTYSSNIVYDNYGRVLASSENSNGKYYMRKNVTYDDKMRVVSYEKSLYSGGQYTKVNIENAYSNWSGDLYQVKDKDKNKVLWELQNTEADGRVKNALLGATKIDNSYGANNFLISTSHKSIAGDAVILQAGYSFNAIKNELNTRTRGGDFNITEIFEYDDNNRLVNWTNPVTGAFTQNAVKNTYDEKGRIIKNDQVGEFTFGNSTKIYQPTKMTLNPEGEQNYNNNLLQKISYNENNDPLFIDGVKGDVAFEYGLSSMRQMATYGGNFDEKGEGGFTKYYSEDGSYEVIRNNQTGQEKHILYIGGTPYESNIVYLKDFAQSSGSYKFLHKDYLGSILAISDEEGNAVEQRHFDAWGNFTHLKMGNGAIITDKDVILSLSKDLLLDRGYTSHEHFTEVGLIHMNGRLYDPLLRRFLNADENIQDMFNTQNYNKYGYVLNNPLMYNDPSGEFLQFILLAAFWKAVFIGALVGVASAVITAGLTGVSISAGGILKSAFIGAVSAAVTFGIGQIFAVADPATGLTNLTKFAEHLGDARIFVQGGMHAVSQGVMSLTQGGNFLSGAISGFMGHIGAEAWGGLMNGVGLSDYAQSTAGMISFGALSGGIGAELSGGNFWQGAVTGGIVAGLNSAMHKMDSPLQKTPQQKEPWDTNGDGKISRDEANNWYRNGKGKGITVDASKVDLNSVDTTGWVEGKTYGVQTLFNSAQGRVLGNITVEYLGNNQVRILPDTYNFEQHGSYLSSPVRNVANSIGRWFAGKGVEYQINFRGINTITPRVYNIERGPKY